MFAPPNYTSLHSFFSDVLKKIEEHTEIKTNSDIQFLRQQIHAEACDWVWGCLNEKAKERKTYIVTPSAEIVLCDVELFICFDPMRSSGKYIDISLGTVGSGDGETNPFREKSDETHENWWRELRQELFGPFLFCPIAMKTSDVGRFLEELIVVYLGEKPDDEALVLRILELHDQDSTRTKTDIKRLLGIELKQEVFNYIWRKAAKQNPNLSKSGPRKQGY